MSLLILCIENHRDKEIDILCDKYIKRLQTIIPVKLELLPAAKVQDPLQQKIKESESILKICKPGDKLFLCDERGTAFSSIKFSNYISNELANSRGKLIFAIGGAYGFTSEILDKFPKIKLSEFTFPHHLARLVLIEQLYRAMSIVKGTGYHHE